MKLISFHYLSSVSLVALFLEPVVNALWSFFFHDRLSYHTVLVLTVAGHETLRTFTPAEPSAGTLPWWLTVKRQRPH